MRVLLVEDDEMIGHSLREALQGQGWSVDWVKDGLLAQSAWDDGDYACVLLDLGLPKRDGVEVLRHARSRGITTPVLVLTARDALDDRVSGLELGADDYLLKPYEMRELLARMRAVIRRLSPTLMAGWSSDVTRAVLPQRVTRITCAVAMGVSGIASRSSWM